jgi:hypothetical protein
MRRLDQPLATGSLDLDPANPRLPEALWAAPEEDQGLSEQARILRFLYENDVLEELMESYIANGFFESEPVIVLPEVAGRRIVVEGNRRLAALMILLQLPPAVEAGVEPSTRTPVTAEIRAELMAIPAVEASDPEDVAAYLGFRHISGLKTWDADAKARWVWKQVKSRVASGSTDPFFEVGRQVGSNARGVRSAYLSFALLRHARDELGIPKRLVDYVQRERFGVWTRLLGTRNLTKHLGLKDGVPGGYGDMTAALDDVDGARLEAVLSDLTPTAEGARPILSDSRDVTGYSDVLASADAVIAMREFRSLDIALQLVRLGNLADRLRETSNSIKVITGDLSRYDLTDEDLRAAEELQGSIRTLRAGIEAVLKGDEE